MLQELAIQYRFLQLFAHNAHNLVCGETFFQDHEFLGEIYPAYESAYDSIIERMIGLGEEIDLSSITLSAAEMVEKSEEKDSAKNWFSEILAGEKGACAIIEKCFKESEYTQGTLNLLAQLEDDSEVRQYKIQQRLK